MLVLIAERLHEAHLGQRPILGGGDELDLVLQVCRTIGGAGGVAREVVERLMVELEGRIGAERVLAVGGRDVRVRARAIRRAVRPARSGRVARRVVPAPRVPRPADAGIAHPIADVQGRVRVIGRRLWSAEAALRLPRRLERIDRPVAAGEARDGRGKVARLGDVAVDRGLVGPVERIRVVRAAREPRGIEQRVLTGRRARPEERLGADQILVVEIRAAERPLEEVVGDHVLRSAASMEVLVDREGRRVVVAHDRPDRVAPGDVAVLLTAVELVLLLVELVDEVAGAAALRPVRATGRGIDRPVHDPVAEAELLVRARTGRRVRRDVLVEVERRVQEVARVGGRASIRERHRLRVAGRLFGERVRRERRARTAREVRVQVDVELLQAGVRRAGLGDLRRVGAIRVRQADHVLAVDVAPQSVQVVEAVVLLVDDHDVLEVAERSLVGSHGRTGRHEADRDEGDGGEDGAQPPASVLHGSSSGAREG